MIKYFLFRIHTVQILFYPFVLIAETKHLQTTKYVITQPRDPSCAFVYLYQVRGITLVCASITTLKWGAKRGSENDGRHFFTNTFDPRLYHTWTVLSSQCIPLLYCLQNRTRHHWDADRFTGPRLLKTWKRILDLNIGLVNAHVQGSRP